MTQTDFAGHSDYDLCYLVGQKAAKEIAETNPDFIESIGGWITLAECIKAVHDINPMRLQEMHDGESGSRLHDVLGCLQYFDWASNQLTECWKPRYSK